MSLEPLGALYLNFNTQALAGNYMSSFNDAVKDFGDGIACLDGWNTIIATYKPGQLDSLLDSLSTYADKAGLLMTNDIPDCCEPSFGYYNFKGAIKRQCQSISGVDIDEHIYKCYLPDYCGPNAPSDSLNPNGVSSSSSSVDATTTQTTATISPSTDSSTKDASFTKAASSELFPTEATSSEASSKQTTVPETSSAKGSTSDASSTGGTASMLPSTQTTANGDSTTQTVPEPDSTIATEEKSTGTIISSAASSEPVGTFAHSELSSINTWKGFNSNETATTTKSDISTTLVTITSCSGNICTEQPVETGVTTITDEEKTYTTYCPLTTSSFSSQVSTATEESSEHLTEVPPYSRTSNSSAGTITKKSSAATSQTKPTQQLSTNAETPSSSTQIMIETDNSANRKGSHRGIELLAVAFLLL